MKNKYFNRIDVDLTKFNNDERLIDNDAICEQASSSHVEDAGASSVLSSTSAWIPRTKARRATPPYKYLKKIINKLNRRSNFYALNLYGPEEFLPPYLAETLATVLQRFHKKNTIHITFGETFGEDDVCFALQKIVEVIDYEQLTEDQKRDFDEIQNNDYPDSSGLSSTAIQLLSEACGPDTKYILILENWDRPLLNAALISDEYYEDTFNRLNLFLRCLVNGNSYIERSIIIGQLPFSPEIANNVTSFSILEEPFLHVIGLNLNTIAEIFFKKSLRFYSTVDPAYLNFEEYCSYISSDNRYYFAYNDIDYFKHGYSPGLSLGKKYVCRRIAKLLSDMSESKLNTIMDKLTIMVEGQSIHNPIVNRFISSVGADRLFGMGVFALLDTVGVLTHNNQDIARDSTDPDNKFSVQQPVAIRFIQEHIMPLFEAELISRQENEHEEAQDTHTSEGDSIQPIGPS